MSEGPHRKPNRPRWAARIPDYVGGRPSRRRRAPSSRPNKKIYNQWLTVYVALGGVGKGLVLLDLALKAIRPKAETPRRLGVANGDIDLGDGPRAFGGEVRASGNAVVIAAEDDRDELHRRAK
jgi:hypothetical protein